MRNTHAQREGDTQREREREAETQAEGAAGSTQGAQCGTRSQDPGLALAPPRREGGSEGGRERGSGVPGRPDPAPRATLGPDPPTPAPPPPPPPPPPSPLPPPGSP
ncbi:unnamed protein product [Nyctereutes procyonoides]|uniref:(raccoon dog) hypothetical protein n=1 Tax=Nyctereutes procyonoides TaxID=34880 RepID=A0A811ZF04_NYCPR|nr:unnamed protein product [Nyctereutes procyonoides]